MDNTPDKRLETDTPADAELIRFIGDTALKSPGVAALGTSIGGMGKNLSRNVLGRDSVYSGVRLTFDETQPAADIFVHAKYGAKIPTLCWQLQTNVSKAVKEKYGLALKTINIHVQGVRFPDQEQPPEEREEQ